MRSNVQDPAPGRRPAVAIVGATGAVGAEFIGCLERRGFPLSSLRLLASARSAGKRMAFRGRDIEIETLSERSFDGIDIALFSAGSAISKQYAPVAVRAGATVVDNSSAFRMDTGVPLVIPEINPEEIARHRGIIANPNCVVLVAMTPLWPLHRANPIRCIVLASYQSASGGGAAMMDELRQATRAHLAERPFRPRVLKHDYAFNLFSHNTKVDFATGYNEEETKVVNETRKIFGAPELRISPTCIRVPVLRAHAAALTVECEHPIAPEEVRTIMSRAPGVRVVDDRINNHFPMPKDASGQDEILVGRIRRDIGDPSGRTVALFVAGDQLLKGAALNAVQIAELLPIVREAAAAA
jgi:aspartate-semialdehyde dehydrogenase